MPWGGRRRWSNLRQWLEQEGHAVLDTGMARSALVGKGIQQAKQGNTLGPVTMTLFYTTDFADRLENEIIPALRAGFVVLTDRYIFSIMARAIARGEDRQWIERVAGFGLVPHAVYYMRAEVKDLVSRVVLGRGAFDFWESGMDIGIGTDMYDSFVRYQTRLIRALDRMAKKYEFTIIDASRPPEEIFLDLQHRISRLQLHDIRKSARARKPAGGPKSEKADAALRPQTRNRGRRWPGPRRFRARPHFRGKGKAAPRAGSRETRRCFAVPDLDQPLRAGGRDSQNRRPAPGLQEGAGADRRAASVRLPERVWEEICAHHDEEQILLTGHEPLLGQFVAFVLDSPALRVDFKKGALVRIHVDRFGPAPHGVLVWMLTPKLAG